MHPAIVRQQRRHRAAQRVALLLVVAWLPTLAFVGHWSALAEPFSGSAPAHANHVPLGGNHAGHCHAGFDSCSGGGTSVLLAAPTLGLLRASPLTRMTFALQDDRALSVRPTAPLTPPPRSER